MPDQSWQHDELQADLARSRRGVGDVTYQKLSLGFWGGSGEMDVFSIRLSRTQPRPTCYEVKVSRSDFLADVRSGKHRRYEPWAERCYFATPAGMVKRDEIPDGWGLITRGANGWNGAKAPKPGRIQDRDWRGLMLAVLLNMHPGPWAEPTRAQKVEHLSNIDIANRPGWPTYRFGREVKAILDESYHNKRELREAMKHMRGLAADIGLEANDDMEANELCWMLQRHLRGEPKPDRVAT